MAVLVGRHDSFIVYPTITFMAFIHGLKLHFQNGSASNVNVKMYYSTHDIKD